MQLDFKNSTPHFWIAALWCTLGTIIFGTIAAITCWIRKCRPSNRKKRKKNVRRAQSVTEFDPQTLSAANKRNVFKNRSASSEHDNSETEQSEKSPLVTAKLETFAKLLFRNSVPSSTTHQQSQPQSQPQYFEASRSCSSTFISKDNQSKTSRHSLTYQYSALESGNGVNERSLRERASRERGLIACQEWIKTTNGRYEIISHLDDIGCRNNKHWFLLNDTTVRTDRLITLLPLPPDCVALEELPATECPKGIIMELLHSLQHPYIYPVLDLGFFYTNAVHYACLVMPFNSRGSLKDLIYKAQWNDTWSRKYTRKSSCLPFSQVQRLGRQILEALLFLRERGFPSHGHLHSGNIILQNGVARLSGLENGLLGLNSRVNAVMWSRNVSDIENMDIICFGHLLFEMCAGYELNSPQPTTEHFELDLDRYPMVVEVLQMIFESPDNRYPTVEDLVLCDLFRNIDLREMRGPCVTSFKHGLSSSTLNLLNAVRRRQGQSLSSSYSDDCSTPLTPPSTPRECRASSRELESADISSDSDEDIENEEGILNEIIITASPNFNISQYDLQNSPIHICDNSIQSDESCMTTIRLNDNNNCLSSETIQPLNSSSISIVSSTSSSAASSSSSSTSNQLTADMNKNSKSRRMEYSKKGIILCNNPSQDSAFGSMTDGELSITSSSIRLSSFQSITSPIDEDIEDIGNDEVNSADKIIKLGASLDEKAMAMTTSSNISSNNNLIITNSVPITTTTNSKSNNSFEATVGVTTNNNLTLEPPKILVNDQNSFYTISSPLKAANTIEVFSQKYRVSSFEDMSMKKLSLKNVNKLAFRSLEEERRIDSAFIPIHFLPPPPQQQQQQHQHQHQPHHHHHHHHPLYDKQQGTTSETNRVFINNNEKFKKLTHAAFSRKITSAPTKDRQNMWKNSILGGKNDLIKSNESLLENANLKRYQYNSQSNDNVNGISLNNILMPCSDSSRSSGGGGGGGGGGDDGYGGNSGSSGNGRGNNSGKAYDSGCGTSNDANWNNNNNIVMDIFNNRLSNRVASNNEISTTNTNRYDTDKLKNLNFCKPRKSRSERYLLSLTKTKQSAITDCENDDEVNICNPIQLSDFDNKKLVKVSSYCGGDRENSKHNKNRNNIDNVNNSEDSSSNSSSPSHHDISQIIGNLEPEPTDCIEEKTPLLDGMEMSPISPIESDELL